MKAILQATKNINKEISHEKRKQISFSTASKTVGMYEYDYFFVIITLPLDFVRSVGTWNIFSEIIKIRDKFFPMYMGEEAVHVPNDALFTESQLASPNNRHKISNDIPIIGRCEAYRPV